MLNIIFKFFVLIFAFGTILEGIYNFPIAVLDIGLLGLTVLLYYLLRLLRVINKKAYLGLLVAGIFLSGINLLPIKVNTSSNLSKYINEKGIVEVIFKGNIYKEIRKNFKVKSLTEFVKIAQIYLSRFFLKQFYLIFLLAFLQYHFPA